MTKFYHFTQTNSGGSFDFDENKGITHHVVIEAESAAKANYRAISVGIYFDGCDSHRDCPCCGDRWYVVSDRDADEYPSVYGKPLGKKIENSFRPWMPIGREIAVHYLDGRVEWYSADGMYSATVLCG